MRLKALLAVLAALPLLQGCALLSRGPSFPDLTPATAEGHLDRVEADLEAEHLEAALDRVVAVRRLEGLSPEARVRAEALSDRVTGTLLARHPDDPGRLRALYQKKLSPRIRARIGMARARALLEQGDRIAAWKQVRDVEQELPSHVERRAAGDVLAEAGLDMIRDPGRYRLVMRYESRGIAALEFLVVTYPSHPRCAEAYAALADTYERRGDLDLAIDRHELLLLYCAGSPQAVRSEARLPYLRLTRLDRDDNDRVELERARRELAEWLRRHPDHELRPWVREVERTAMARLAANDILLARYYERIDVPFGARFHAERAAEEADAAGREGARDEALALLERLGAGTAEDAAPLARVPDSGAPAAAAPDGGGAP